MHEIYTQEGNLAHENRNNGNNVALIKAQHPILNFAWLFRDGEKNEEIGHDMHEFCTQAGTPRKRTINNEERASSKKSRHKKKALEGESGTSPTLG